MAKIAAAIPIPSTKWKRQSRALFDDPLTVYCILRAVINLIQHCSFSLGSQQQNTREKPYCH